MFYAYSICREKFQYLEQLGFTLTNSVEASGNNARYDGFHFEWIGKIRIKVSYYEQEVDVVFQHRGTSASYWYIWSKILKKESRFTGAMFPGDSLEKAITTLAEDINNCFTPILNGDDGLWSSIEEELEKDAAKRKQELEEALVDVPKLVKPTFQEAFDHINNKRLEGLRRKFAPKHNILQINKIGFIETLYTFKKQPTSLQGNAALAENHSTVQIYVDEDMYATVEELRTRVKQAASILVSK